MKRDLTQQQFEHRARKLGCTPEGFMGYWKLPPSKSDNARGVSSTAVSVLNAGNRRRDWLKYLKAQIKKQQESEATE